MKDWKPQLDPALDYTRLDLDAEGGFVLSRIDGSTTVAQLAQLTGLSDGKIHGILRRLHAQGAFGSEGPPSELSRAGAKATDARAAPADEENGPEDAPPPEDQDGSAEDDGDDAAEGEADLDEGATANLRKLFETTLHALPADQRVAMAHTASGDTLSALCFDPDPAVIRAVLENALTGLEQARLIARHHRNASGLEALGRNAQLLADGQVQRLLLRNVQTPTTMLHRVLAHKALRPLYQLSVSRELTERAKAQARKALRAGFMQASAEEKVALVFHTEGRCLGLLVGLSFDTKATALLCRRTYQSTMLIQNMLRFPATPPLVLQHIYKQPLVRRAPHLRRLVEQHPNCPSQLKKGG